jgi:hypothetical protein
MPIVLKGGVTYMPDYNQAVVMDGEHLGSGYPCYGSATCYGVSLGVITPEATNVQSGTPANWNSADPYIFWGTSSSGGSVVTGTNGPSSSLTVQNAGGGIGALTGGMKWGQRSGDGHTSADSNASAFYYSDTFTPSQINNVIINAPACNGVQLDGTSDSNPYGSFVTMTGGSIYNSAHVGFAVHHGGATINSVAFSNNWDDDGGNINVCRSGGNGSGYCTLENSTFTMQTGSGWQTMSAGVQANGSWTITGANPWNIIGNTWTNVGSTGLGNGQISYALTNGGTVTAILSGNNSITLTPQGTDTIAGIFDQNGGVFTLSNTGNLSITSSGQKGDGIYVSAGGTFSNTGTVTLTGLYYGIFNYSSAADLISGVSFVNNYQAVLVTGTGLFTLSHSSFTGSTNADIFVNGAYPFTEEYDWTLLGSGNYHIWASGNTATLNIDNIVCYGAGTNYGICLVETGSPASGTVNIYNSVLANLSQGISGTANHTYNIYTCDWFGNSTNYATGTYNLTPATQMASNPLFVNPGSGNFRIPPSSPLKYAGTNISLTTDYAGRPVKNPPTIGIYEFYPTPGGGMLMMDAQ